MRYVLFNGNSTFIDRNEIFGILYIIDWFSVMASSSNSVAMKIILIAWFGLTWIVLDWIGLAWFGY